MALKPLTDRMRREWAVDVNGYTPLRKATVVPEYTITPLADPGWRLDPAEFIRNVENRWPHAKTAIYEAGSPMAANALIPFDNSRGELGVALDQLCYAVILDPADPDSAAEFIAWYLTKLPAFEPDVLLIGEDYEVTLRLSHVTRTKDVQRFLAEN